MAVRAVVFDVGGVLEVTPRLGMFDKWEERLGLHPGEFAQRTLNLWMGGSVGTVSLEQVHAGLGEALGLDEATVNALMDDMWTEYLGTLNVELTEYVRGLRPRYQTAILSNSFVGAREKEQEHYGFPELVDLIVYSHEVGLSKPDRRIYLLTCERLGVQPEEVVFLDDVAPIVDAAREFGMQAIRYENNAQAIADIEVRLSC